LDLGDSTVMAASMDADDGDGATKVLLWVFANELDDEKRTGFVHVASFEASKRNQHFVLTTTVPIAATTEVEIDAILAAGSFRPDDQALRALTCQR